MPRMVWTWTGRWTEAWNLWRRACSCPDPSTSNFFFKVNPSPNLHPISLALEGSEEQLNWLSPKRSQKRAARMRLIPLTVEAAIAGLVRTAKRTLDIATPTLDRTVNGSSIVARAKFEVGCLRIILGQLEQLPLDDLWIIPLHRRAQVELVHLVALLGEGVLALDCVAYLLDDSIAEGGDADARDRTEELVDAVWRLQYFRTSMWLLLNVLQRSV